MWQIVIQSPCIFSPPLLEYSLYLEDGFVKKKKRKKSNLWNIGMKGLSSWPVFFHVTVYFYDSFSFSLIHDYNFQPPFPLRKKKTARLIKKAPSHTVLPLKGKSPLLLTLALHVNTGHLPLISAHLVNTWLIPPTSASATQRPTQQWLRLPGSPPGGSPPASYLGLVEFIRFQIPTVSFIVIMVFLDASPTPQFTAGTGGRKCSALP